MIAQIHGFCLAGGSELATGCDLVYMAEDAHTIGAATRLLFISKYMERIADHATNIAEMVIFMVKGKVVRHMDKNQQ